MLRPRALRLLFLWCTAAVTLHTAAEAVPSQEIKVGTRWPQLIASNGKVFRNVKFTFVSPREVRFMHTDGIGSLPLSEVLAPGDGAVPIMSENMPPELTMGPLGSMMTPQERKVSGIDKLSNDEQATLAKWVLGTVEDRLKEELGRRGLPPTFAPLVPVADTGAAVAVAPAGGAWAPPATATDSAPYNGAVPSPGTLSLPGDALSAPADMALAAATARTNRILNSGARLSTPSQMTSGLGRTYGPPSPLLPPPDSAAGRAVLGERASGAETSTASRAGGRQVKGSIGVVESSIAGEFSGMDAGRQYRLANGQTWVQQEAFAHDHPAFKPRVTIYPAQGGSGWMMVVDGVDKPVRVAPMN